LDARNLDVLEFLLKGMIWLAVDRLCRRQKKKGQG